MPFCTMTSTCLRALALLCGAMGGAAALADKPCAAPKDPAERDKLAAALRASPGSRLGAAVVRALLHEGQFPAGARCITCQGGDAIEGEENCGVPVDTTNGGCNSSPPVFGAISNGQTVCGTGALDNDPTDPNFLLRDTDWYEITLATTQQVTWTVSAQFDTLIGVVDTNGNPGCPASAFRRFGTGDACSELSIRACLPAGTWYLFVAPDFFGATFPVGCGSTYRATLNLSDCPPPPAGDECASAATIPCGGSATIDNTDATENANDPAFSCAFGGAAQGFGTVWFQFVASETGATLDTNLSTGIDDTLLAVYSGTCEGLNEVACDDDSGDGLLSRVRVTGLNVGQTYYVQAAAYAAATPRGEIVVNLVCAPIVAPPNDECAGALTIPCGGSANTDNTDATNNPNDPIFECRVGDPGPGSGTVWFKFVATQIGATVDTEGSSGITDTLLAVYSGGCEGLAQIGCDDDGGSGFLSRVRVSGLTVGQTYYIEAAAYADGSDRGDIAVNVACAPIVVPPNDECTGALTITCGSSDSTDNTDATENPNDPVFACVAGGTNRGFGTVWFKFVATQTGATIDTDLSSGIEDTLLAVYSGSCGNLAQIACDDDSGAGLYSRVRVPGLTVGQTYYIEAAAYAAGTTRGNIVVSVACAPVSAPANDECSGALPIQCNGTASTDNTDATDNPGDPIYSCRVGGAGRGFGTVWFKFAPTATVATLDTRQCDPAIDTMLAVYSGSCVGLTEIGCNDDIGGGDLHSEVTVGGLTVGQTYYVQASIFAAGGTHGNIIVALQCGGTGSYCPASVAIPCNSNEYISAVQVGSINNTSPCGLGYEDFTAQSTNIGAGASLPIRVEVSSFFSIDTVTVFCDWNHDFVLNGLGEAFPLTPDAAGEPRLFNGTITAPPGATAGATRMRIRLNYGASGNPCGATTFGNVEDYSINVTGGCPCLGYYATGNCATDQDAIDVVLFNFHRPPGGPYTNGDLDGDGDVDQDDIDWVLFDYGCSGNP